MTTLAPAAAPAAPNRDPAGAAELAARIQIPRRLPVRYDGQPLRHLSHSSYSRFLLCPEDWRRHYLKGERTPPSGAMFLGGRVDDALTTYYRRLLEHGDTLTLDQLHDAYRDHWTRELAAEQAQRGIALGRRARRAARLHRSACEAVALTLDRARAADRPARRRAARARLRARARPGMDDPVLPRPRDAAAEPSDGGEPVAGDRRLQGQDHPALAGQGRPRPAGRPLPRRPLARRATPPSSSASPRSASPAPGASR